MQKITEAIKHLKFGVSGIIVFDIDDTLIRANSNNIKIIKYINGDRNNIKYLSTAEFAKDEDIKQHKDWFDFREFNTPEKVIDSIISGQPIIRNLKILDAYINAGYEFCFLTARGCEDAVTYAIETFLKYRDKDGILKSISPKLNKKLSAAINDINKNYKGDNDPEKKANVLRKLCKLFDHVVFVDDDKKNRQNANDLGLSNLVVIKAWE